MLIIVTERVGIIEGVFLNHSVPGMLTKMMPNSK